MGVSCQFDGCCAAELADAGQLELHAAFKHVPFHELLFVCTQCAHRPQFAAPSLLLAHKQTNHQHSDIPSNDIQTDALGVNTADNLPAPAKSGKEQGALTNKKRFQCNRCAYGTNHSAWLLQKHVIYEHLVDQLGHAHEHDPGLSVPRVDKAGCDQAKVEEAYYDEWNCTEPDAYPSAAAAPVGHAESAFAGHQYLPLRTDLADPDFDPQPSAKKSKKPAVKRVDYGEAMQGRSIKGRNPIYRYNSKRYPGKVFEFIVTSVKANGAVYVRCVTCQSMKKKTSSLPIARVQNGRFVGIDPDYTNIPHICITGDHDAVEHAIKQQKRKAMAAMDQWGTLLKPKELHLRVRDELLADPDLSDEQRQAAIRAFPKLSQMRSSLLKHKARCKLALQAAPNPPAEPPYADAVPGTSAAAVIASTVRHGTLPYDDSMLVDDAHTSACML